ncbi:MAG: hypothetical protein FWE19_00455 [Oscillospiraceae bacterium]|nr:hypothetical protein [Oscillospiraceae bacterium]
MPKEKICGNCYWRRPDKDGPRKPGGGWQVWECANVESTYFAEETDYNGICESWEERE